MRLAELRAQYRRVEELLSAWMCVAPSEVPPSLIEEVSSARTRLSALENLELALDDAIH